MIAVAAVVVGCGDSSNTGSGPPAGHGSWTEQQVIQAAGLHLDAHGISYQSAHCDQVAQILNTRQEVQLYSGAGDTVVTNADGTAGVKVVGGDAVCRGELERGLATLK